MSYSRLLIFFASFAVIAMSAAEVEGTFDDKGVTVSTGHVGSSARASASLHALFNLHFPSGTAPTSTYSGTRQVRLSNNRDRLQVTMRDLENRVIGTQSWRTATYVAPEGNGVAVRIQSPQVVEDSFLLLLETHSDGALLQVRVIHLKATTIGPDPIEVGIFYFPRSP